MTALFRLPDAVIFDWDNTMIDSWGCIHHAMNATLRAMDHPEWTLAETRARVGRSMRDSFPDLFGARWQEAGAVFTQVYTAIHLQHLTPLPDAERLLARLHELGVVVGVVSNKRGPFLREEAAQLGWDRYLHRLIGANDAHADKPDPAPVAAVLAGAALPAVPVLWFVGDSHVDIQCGQAAGCFTCLVGEDPSDALQHGPAPDWIGEGCTALLAAIEKLIICNSAI